MKYSKAPGLLLALGMILFLSLLPGCSQTTEAAQPEKPIPRVKLTLIPLEENGNFQPSFTAEELGCNYDGTLFYHCLSGVFIELDGQTYPIEEAVRNDVFTLEQLEGWARQDARDGLCWMRNDTENGLTRFQYRYDSYVLDVIDDVYETPDGKTHLIQRFHIRDSSENPDSLGGHGIEKEGGSVYTSFLDLEDWGISFEVVEAYPTGMTVKATQSGGQQFGNLFIYKYELISYDKDRIYWPGDKASINQPLKMEGSNTFDIDWDDWIGFLPVGNYMLRLFVEDFYTEDQIPPLSRNFYDRQVYEIDFTIQ